MSSYILHTSITQKIHISNISISDEDYNAGILYNTTFMLQVTSGAFAGLGMFEIDIADLCSFAKSLFDLHNNLSGKVTLRDIGHGSFLTFEVTDRAGHIQVGGEIFGNAAIHHVKFEFEIDQTELYPFCKNLFDDFGALQKYKPPAAANPPANPPAKKGRRSKPIMFSSLFIALLALSMACQNRSNIHSPLSSPTPIIIAASAEATVITFADPAIETYTRKLLDKPTGAITKEEVLDITVFGDMSGENGTLGNITTLADLSWFSNLHTLVLSNCDISDLTGIENLQNLRTLYVRHNRITDLSPVRNLTNLVKLDCARNPIQDFSSLSALHNLQSLCIGDNGHTYTNLSPLKDLTNLEKLYAPWCGIEDISILSNMPELTYLQLYGNNISDISALSTLAKLEYLELGLNPIPEDILDKYKKTKPSDYFTTTFHEKIQADMPEFTFEVLSYRDAFMSGYSTDALTISDSATGRIIQEVSIPELSLFDRTNVSIYHEEKSGFTLEDVNFDGYQDIRLFDTQNGNYRTEWIYLVWNPSKGIFEHDKRLNAISLATFDQEKQLIYGMERGSAVDHWYFTYQYVEEELVLIELESNTSVRFFDQVTDAQISECIPEFPVSSPHTFQYISIEKRNAASNKMERTEAKFMLYTADRQTLLAEYSIDSAIGTKLAELADLPATLH